MNIGQTSEQKTHDEEQQARPPAPPKLRWTPPLRRRFVDAMNALGGPNKATPNRILQLISTPGLTASHVKKHLQMYKTRKHETAAEDGLNQDAVVARSLFRDRTAEEEDGRGGGVSVKSFDLTGQTTEELVAPSTAHGLVLQFANKLPSAIFVGSKIEAEDGTPLRVELIDPSTNRIIAPGLFPPLKIEITVLNGELGSKDFHSNTIKGRDARRSLMHGEPNIVLTNGVGQLSSKLAFSKIPSWLRCERFRLGAKPVQSSWEVVRIREAVSEPFSVKDSRPAGRLKEYYRDFPLHLGNPVCRLEGIDEGGVFHKRLSSEGINTVKKFLKAYVADQTSLRSVLGGGISNRTWNSIIKHAKTCAVDKSKLYVYNDHGQGLRLVFNSVYKLLGAMFDAGQRYEPLDQLSPHRKVLVENSKVQAYSNLNRWIPTDPRSISWSPAVRKAEPVPFISKTYQLVDDPSNDHIVSWGEDGCTFVIWQLHDFTRDLLPCHFKIINFNSFVHQLISYGFRKITPGKWELANKFFKRGEKHLLSQIHHHENGWPLDLKDNDLISSSLPTLYDDGGGSRTRKNKPSNVTCSSSSSSQVTTPWRQGNPLFFASGKVVVSQVLSTSPKTERIQKTYTALRESHPVSRRRSGTMRTKSDVRETATSTGLRSMQEETEKMKGRIVVDMAREYLTASRIQPCNSMMHLSKYPSFQICAHNFVSLFFPHCNLHHLWKGGKQLLVNLRLMDLNHSSLFQIPNLSNSQKLESLNLEGCQNLVEVSSIQYLGKLQHLNLKGCKSLKGLPSLIRLKFLETLNLSHCSSLTRLPPSLGCLPNLCELNLRNCSKLDSLPGTVMHLMGSLETLNISGCSNLWKSKSKDVDGAVSRSTHQDNLTTSSSILISESTEEKDNSLESKPIQPVELDAAGDSTAQELLVDLKETKGKKAREWEQDEDNYMAVRLIDYLPSELRTRLLLPLETGVSSSSSSSSSSFSKENNSVDINTAENNRLVLEDKQKLCKYDDHEDAKSEKKPLPYRVGSVCCQVEDCGGDLSKAKTYHQKNKICEVHCQASKALLVDSLEQFCLQCCRFHVLDDFDDGERNCRVRLAGYHQKQRRKSNTTTSEMNLEGESNTSESDEKYSVHKRARTNDDPEQNEPIKSGISLEDWDEADALGNIENDVLEMIEKRLSSNCEEKEVAESVAAWLAELEHSVPETVMSMKSAKAEAGIAAEKLKEVDARLTVGGIELSLLDAELSRILEEEAEIEAELQRLMDMKSGIKS